MDCVPLHAIIYRLKNTIMAPQSELYYTTSPLLVTSGTFMGTGSLLASAHEQSGSEKTQPSSSTTNNCQNLQVSAYCLRLSTSSTPPPQCVLPLPRPIALRIGILAPPPYLAIHTSIALREYISKQNGSLNFSKSR